MVRQAVSLQPVEVHGGADIHLQPVEVHGGADIHLQPVEDPTPEQGGARRRLSPRGEPVLEQGLSALTLLSFKICFSPPWPPTSLRAVHGL